MSYVGNRSNDPIIDLMLDTLQDRGYDGDNLDEAVGDWNNEGEGEDAFWTEVIGPAIDSLEGRLHNYGLKIMEDKDAPA